ncbi:glycosyltransferase family 4 protein [Epilithonimonas zeae]|uniref:glycosyltransferase family 4 protein n=1 Tax=Epilithonimonas zeae TaxID=1416779 RepID=UPI00201099D0|nr:glycosyltransferase family 4 protein [Epilithonimonas zeae]UQB67767.1 glycosyltransferase family 4 protein [Epilithonimonas zeae]
MNPKIAFLTPGRHNPMGVFSESYMNNIPNIERFFGNDIPFFPEGTSRKRQRFIRYLLTILSFKNDRLLQNLYKLILKRYLKKRKIDFVIAEFLTTGASVVEVCQSLNLPLITNVLGHEINRKDYLDLYDKKYRMLANYKQSYIIPVSKDMIPKLRKYKFKNIIYSPIGAKPFFFDVKPDYHSNNLLAMGRFVDIKSPLDTIRAFKIVNEKYNHIRLNFVGVGDLWEEAKTLARDLKISDKINFIGSINQTKQLELFEEAAIFLQHSVTAKNGDSEGTPVVIIEASAAGIPVVSTKHAGIVDVVKDNESGFLVEEHDYKAMADKILDLLENRNKLKTFGENGREFIKENFTAKHHTDVVQKIIDSF